MPKSILIDLNLNKNELQNAVVQNLASAPENPLAGQFYFNTVNNALYIFDGTNWVNALSQGDYTFQNGVVELTGADAGKVQLDIASGANAGNVTLTANSNGLKAEVAEASTSTKGIIEIATDSEAITGTAENLAINPKQLVSAVEDKIELTDLSIDSNSTNYMTYDNSTGEFGVNVDTTPDENSTNLITSGAVYDGLDGKVDKLSSAVTAGTYTKVTVQSDGLVSAGSSLVASDIPDISATYIATILKGAANGVAELDSSGLVPTSQLPSYVDDVVELLAVTDTAPATCAKGDMYYNTTSKKIFTATAANTWGSTGADPEKSKIYVALDNNNTYRWSGSTMVNLGGPIGAATESQAGIIEIATSSEVATGTDDERAVTPLKLAGAFTTYNSATVTLTNKTIDADDNTITDLTTSNFKSGVVVDSTTGIAAVSSASDTKIATEKAIATKLADKVEKFAINNTTLTPVSNKVTWTVTNTLGSADVEVRVIEISTGLEVGVDIAVTASTITITFNASSTVQADTYRVIVVG